MLYFPMFRWTPSNIFSEKSNSEHNIMRMVIEELNWEGGVISAQNSQDSSDCAKNRAPDRSWLVIDVRIWVWSKSRSELGDRFHQSWRLEFPYINYNGEIVSKSTSNSGFRGCSQLWWTLSPSSDGLFDQTQILSSNTIHELSGARFLAQSDESCTFWAASYLRLGDRYQHYSCPMVCETKNITETETERENGARIPS